MNEDLIDLTQPKLDIEIDLAYATPDNFTGKPVYRHAGAYLHRDAASHLGKAIALAGSAGLRLRIFDAFRPSEAQWILWEHTPDPNYLADPRKGSPHSRGVAVDLTLVGADGQALDMGTGFDDFSARAHHGSTDIEAQAQRNRMMLLGIMTAAGWDHYLNEWWHYQLFDSRRYAMLGDDALDKGMM